MYWWYERPYGHIQPNYVVIERYFAMLKQSVKLFKPVNLKKKKEKKKKNKKSFAFIKQRDI